MLLNTPSSPPPITFWLKWCAWSIVSSLGGLFFSTFGAICGVLILAVINPPMPGGPGPVSSAIAGALMAGVGGGSVAFGVVTSLLERSYLQSYFCPPTSWVLIGSIGWALLLPLIAWLLQFSQVYWLSIPVLALAVSIGVIRWLAIHNQVAHAAHWVGWNLLGTSVIPLTITLFIRQ